jgi:hypothetical protein
MAQLAAADVRFQRRDQHIDRQGLAVALDVDPSRRQQGLRPDRIAKAVQVPAARICMPETMHEPAA